MNRITNRIASLLVDWKAPGRWDWRAGLACLAGGLLLWPLVRLLPVVGWDWYYWFYVGNIDFYPPWTRLVIAPLVALPWREGLALLNALMLMTVAVSAAQAAWGKGRSSRLGAAALALLTPPVFMALWLGNIEGLVLLGMVALPPGMVLALMKPNLTIWAAIARRSWLAWAVGVLAVSLLIWGWWPARMTGEMGRLSQNLMAIGWFNLGWPEIALGIVLLLFSNADPLRLMAAGFLLTPYLMPNHMLLLLPAFGRVSGWRRLALWAACWLSVLGAGMGPALGRSLALLFPLAVWGLLSTASFQRRPAGVLVGEVQPQ